MAAFKITKGFMNSTQAVAAILDSDTESDGEESSGDEYRPDVSELNQESSSEEDADKTQNDATREILTDITPTENNIAEPNERGRKRTRNEENWQQNRRKRARNCGEEYLTRENKKVEKRKIKYHRCGRCVNRCNELLTDEQRDVIFMNYWKMGNRQRQRDYIANHVRSKPTKRNSKPGSKRKQTLWYFVTVGNSKVKVCKAVFLKTLGIGEKTVMYTLQHREETGQACTDKRGKQAPGIKKSDEIRNSVKRHISSFPHMESHYTRNKTSRKYLEKNLTVRKMHELYQEEHTDFLQVKLKYYRDVFNTDFNLSFHKPKKDVCNFCFSYNNSSEKEQLEKQADYDNHHTRKTRVRQLKAEHKALAKDDKSIRAVTFDLEQVLLSPKLNVSSLFYRRKLSTYNLTVYDLASHDVTCYMWHEGVAGRGSCEISSSINSYFNQLPRDVKRVILYSDTCSGQNRNQFFTAMCLHAVKDSNIDCVDHLYMESGHSQMECDSSHSTIEYAFRKQDVYSPLDYYRIVAMARRENPFEVKLLSTKDITDFKAYSRQIIRNRSKDVDGNTIQWLKLKWMQYLKSSPDTVYFKYEYDAEFKAMRVNQGLRIDSDITLTPLFQEAPRISKAKYDDLKFLCTSLAIPRDYHSFYEKLNFDGKIVDTLTEPDADETIPADSEFE